MSTQLRNYSSASVLIVAGGIPLSGMADDTFVEIAPVADRVSAMVGADGEIARSINPNRMHTVTITLQATSASNDILSGLAAVDDMTSGGGVFPISVQDLSGRTLFAASQAWVSALPTITFGAEAGTREWTLTTGQPSAFMVGGNF